MLNTPFYFVRLMHLYLLWNGFTVCTMGISQQMCILLAFSIIYAKKHIFSQRKNYLSTGLLHVEK